MRSAITHVGVLAMLIASMVASATNAFGQAPVRSFTELRLLVTPGERLIVRDKTGKTTKGRLVSLSVSELEIKRRRWNFRTERKTWKEAAVRRIEHEDSGWNGNLIGAGAGVAAILMMVKSPACDMRCLLPAGVAVPVGAMIGDAVDRSVNRTVYESPTP